VELDPFCRRVLAKHWPDVPRYDDVRTVEVESLERVDLVCGGVPCQPFSSASRGRKLGTADDRWLWPAMLRVVQAIRPAWVLVEEVPHFDGPGLEELVSDLEASRYEVAPPLEIPACALGHDHRRARLWILAHTDSHSEPGRPLDGEAPVLPGRGGEPGGVGATDGLPGGLDRDRLRVLGNAVVPDVAEFVGRRIMEVS
jgi:DNA (cytosine-5)-methyltransferase 1